MNPKLQELAQSLLAGTRAGAFQWAATPEPGVYRLMLDKGLVRIYKLDPMSVGDNFAGLTVLNSEGVVLYDVQARRLEGGPLVELYDLVDGSFQEAAMNDLLAEVRDKVASSRRS
jgi:hypothetical protein